MFDLRILTLEPTATFSRRLAVWAPMPHPNADRLGIVTFDQRGRIESDEYHVTELKPINPSTRRFQLVKIAGDKSENVVQIGGLSLCTCHGSQKGRTHQCRHKDAMSAILKPKQPATESLAIFDEFSPGTDGAA